MEIIKDVLETTWTFENTCVTIGAFDGIHVGHRKLISKTVETARKTNCKSVVFTFLEHPSEKLSENRVKFINSLEEKIYLIESLGVDYLILQPFTNEFCDFTPEEFVEKILKNKLHAKEIFVGFNFHFGKNAAGNTETLKEIGRKNEINVNIIEPVKINEEIVSSTLIRNTLEKFKFKEAVEYLGENFLVSGEVIHGKKYGRLLGFPTANLKIKDKIYTPFGIYGGKVKIDGEKFYRDAVINIGKNPTLKENESSIEVHILDFDEDIYGKTIYTFLIEHLRTEQKFNSLEELKDTINNDVINWKRKIKKI